jgi:beta-ureidopropionase
MIVSPCGEILAEASATKDDITVADVDLSALPKLRELWGYYRDRRPEMYGPVVNLPAGAVHPAATREPAPTRAAV